MAHMSAAIGAMNLDARIAQLVVCLGFDGIRLGRLPEGWPAGTGLVFMVRRESGLAANGAMIGPGPLFRVERVGEGRFGAFGEGDGFGRGVERVPQARNLCFIQPGHYRCPREWRPRWHDHRV